MCVKLKPYQLISTYDVLISEETNEKTTLLHFFYKPKNDFT